MLTKVGNFVLLYDATYTTGGAGAVVANGTNATTNTVPKNLMDNNQQDDYSPAGVGASITNCSMVPVLFVTVTGPNASIVLASPSGSMTAIVNADLYICQLSNPAN